jgi:hypothetical protein
MKLRNILLAIGLTIGLASTASSAFATSTAPHSAAGSASASANVLTVTPDASGGTTICAHSNVAYCADLVGTSNVVGAKIWLYPNGSDDHWIVTLNTQGCSIISIPCYFVEDAQDTSLCMSATGTGGAPIELERCNDSGSWYNEGNYILGNGKYGAGGNLDAQAIGTHDYLYALNGGNYDQFTVYGWN